MARLGAFDSERAHRAAFDAGAVNEGWLDAELIHVPATDDDVELFSGTRRSLTL